jgi:hypothetical protein
MANQYALQDAPFLAPLALYPAVAGLSHFAPISSQTPHAADHGLIP